MVEIIRYGTQPMFGYFPKQRQLIIHSCHKYRDRQMCGWSRGIGADLGAIILRITHHVRCCWRKMTSLFETINLEIQMQDRRAEHRGEKGIHTSFALCDDLNSIQRVLKETKYEFDLPSIRIQDNDLKCCYVGSICD